MLGLKIAFEQENLYQLLPGLGVLMAGACSAPDPSYFRERGQGEARTSLQLRQRNAGKIIMDSTALLNLIINEPSLIADIEVIG